MTSRRWIITVNNPTYAMDDPSSLGWDDMSASFVAGQEEGIGGKKNSNFEIQIFKSWRQWYSPLSNLH